MPSFDRTRGGTDTGRDKPPAPQPALYEPVTSARPPLARNRSHYESSAAEQNNRTAAEGADGREHTEGTSQGSVVRPKDKPEERGAHGGEGIAAGGNHSRRPGDASRETDSRTGKNTDTVKQYQTLFDRQGELIDTQKQRIDTLKTDIDKLEKRNEKLEDRNEKLETRLEQRDQTIDRQASEIDRLKAENAALREKVSAGEGQTRVRASTDAVPASDRDVHQQEGSTPWYKRMPGSDSIALGTAMEGLGQTIAENHHMINGTTEGYIAGGVTVGVAGYNLLKKAITNRYEKKDGNNAG